jgi:hypothetical protein
MDSTDPNARDFGNYVLFENISPDSGGTFVLTLTPEPPATPGVGDAMPALNALQLVRITAAGPSLTAVRGTGANMTISWTASANGYTLASSPSVTGPWTAVSGAPNPISGAGSVSVPTATGMRFFRFQNP